jgi:hypothetical protein
MYIKETTGKNVNLDDHNQMFTAVQENSHIVADFFDHRTQNYFRGYGTSCCGRYLLV